MSALTQSQRLSSTVSNVRTVQSEELDEAEREVIAAAEDYEAYVEATTGRGHVSKQGKRLTDAVKALDSIRHG